MNIAAEYILPSFLQYSQSIHGQLKFRNNLNFVQKNIVHSTGVKLWFYLIMKLLGV